MTDQELRILHLEDLPSDAALAKREISKVLKKYSIRVVETEAAFISELEGFNPHIVISDFQLPTFNGLSALKIVLNTSPITPVIILTGSMNEDTAVDCMKAGAADYVIKEHMKRLGSSILNALEQKEIKIQKNISEAALKESEERYRLLYDNSLDAVLLTAPNGEILHANTAACNIFGRTEDEIRHIGRKGIIDINDPRLPIALEDRLRTGKFSGELTGLRRDGSKFPIEISSALFYDSNNNLRSSMIVRDISERKLKEVELIQAKEKAEKSDHLKTAFLQNMSHEIRTPMNAIIGFSNLLAENFNDKPKLEQFIQIISQRCSDLLDIIDEILDISKIESGHLSIKNEECKLVSLFSELSMFFKEYQKRQNKEHIKFNIEAHCGTFDSIILADNVKLKQILINLIGNAFKFTIKGEINVGCKLDSNHQLFFFVSDTGIGIPTDKQNFIFERFAQLEQTPGHLYGGTGLGLSIVKGLIDLMNGKIWLESELNKGTTFNFSFPYERLSPIPHETIVNFETNEKYDFSNKTLLIVEDDLYNSEYLREILSGTGFTILQSMYGNEAIEIAKSQDLDIILMDIRLPDIDGYAATRAMKKIKPYSIIIAQTAYAAHDDKVRAIDAGCSDYISKPVKREALLSILKKQLSNL